MSVPTYVVFVLTHATNKYIHTTGYIDIWIYGYMDTWIYDDIYREREIKREIYIERDIYRERDI